MTAIERRQAASFAVQSILEQSTDVAYPMVIEILNRGGRPMRRVELATKQEAVDRMQVLSNQASSPMAHSLKIIPAEAMRLKSWVKVIQGHATQNFRH